VCVCVCECVCVCVCVRVCVHMCHTSPHTHVSHVTTHTHASHVTTGGSNPGTFDGVLRSKVGQPACRCVTCLTLVQGFFWMATSSKIQVPSSSSSSSFPLFPFSSSPDSRTGGVGAGRHAAQPVSLRRVGASLQLRHRAFKFPALLFTACALLNFARFY